jgi:large conductance mechanosensitive channel
MATTKKAPVKKAPVIKQAAQKPISSRNAVLRKSAALSGVGKSQLKGFVDFIRTQGVVGLAVGLVLGGAVSVLVKSLIDNLVMPPLGFLLGSSDGLKGLVINMGKIHGGQVAVLHYGVFLNDLLNFIVIALVIYLTVHLLGFDKLDKEKE